MEGCSALSSDVGGEGYSSITFSSPQVEISITFLRRLASSVSFGGSRLTSIALVVGAGISTTVVVVHKVTGISTMENNENLGSEGYT